MDDLKALQESQENQRVIPQFGQNSDGEYSHPEQDRSERDKNMQDSDDHPYDSDGESEEDHQNDIKFIDDHGGNQNQVDSDEPSSPEHGSKQNDPQEILSSQSQENLNDSPNYLNNFTGKILGLDTGSKDESSKASQSAHKNPDHSKGSYKEDEYFDAEEDYLEPVSKEPSSGRSKIKE